MESINTQISEQDQNMDKFKKKCRQGRRNDSQLSYLVDYMVQNPHVATGKFNSLHGKDNLKGSWEDLVGHLNNLRNPGVKEKDVKSWKESWRDLKTKVSKRASSLRNAKRLTGNKAITIPELNEQEKKVLGLMGFEYVEGTTCPDSFPEDQFENLERLTAGDDSILRVEPRNDISIRSFVYGDSDILHDDNLNKVAEDNFYFENDILDEPTFTPTLQIPSTSTLQSSPTASKTNNIRKRKLSQNQKNTVRKNLRTQLGDARDTFTKLAQSNAQYMDNLSQSIQQLAHAMTRMAENDDRRLHNEENMVIVMKQLMERVPNHNCNCTEKK